MTTKIRPARAADAPFLSWVILAAGRSHVTTSFWDLLLDRPGDAAVRSFLERIVVAPRRSWWHHAHFLVAERDGEPGAALAGFPAEDAEIEAPPAAIARALGEHGLAPPAVEEAFRRAAPFLTCTMDPTLRAWIVENVATSPAHRRRGLADALLDEILETGRARGHALAQLTLFIGNRPAQRAYEGHGFRVVAERCDPGFEAAIGCPGLARMERAI